jgi:hypothetical protein
VRARTPVVADAGVVAVDAAVVAAAVAAAAVVVRR